MLLEEIDVLSRNSTSWQQSPVGALLILTVAATVCVGPHAPVRIAVGSPNRLGSSTPYAKPGVVCMSPHKRPPFQKCPPAQTLAPPLLPPTHFLPSLMGFSVSGNVVL